MNEKMHFGKRFELRFLADLDKYLSEKIEYQVFLPLIDDNGIDYTIRKANGEYKEIQIKARHDKRLFTINNDFEASDNYWFVFYCCDDKEKNEYNAYVLPSKYVQSVLNKSKGNHIKIKSDMKRNNFNEIFDA